MAEHMAGMTHRTLYGFTRPITPTINDGSLPATPRRIRLNTGEMLDHYLGKPFTAKVGGQFIQVQKGDYVGRSTVLSHRYVLTHTFEWERVGEPFPLERH